MTNGSGAPLLTARRSPHQSRVALRRCITRTCTPAWHVCKAESVGLLQGEVSGSVIAALSFHSNLLRMLNVPPPSQPPLPPGVAQSFLPAQPRAAEFSRAPAPQGARITLQPSSPIAPTHHSTHTRSPPSMVWSTSSVLVCFCPACLRHVIHFHCLFSTLASPAAGPTANLNYANHNALCLGGMVLAGRGDNLTPRQYQQEQCVQPEKQATDSANGAGINAMATRKGLVICTGTEQEWG